VKRSLPAVLSMAASAGVIGIGALGVAFPKPVSRAFGVVAEDDATVAYVRAASIRDVAIGAMLLGAAARGKRGPLQIGAAAGAAISISDFLVAKRPVHAGGAVYFLGILALLLVT